MYVERFQLTGQPFQLTPDARFWFESRTHRKAMAYLGYGLAQGEGFVIVTGEIGAGKSTLVSHLLATIDRARLTAISLVSTQVEADDVLRLVAQGLGIATGAVEKARLLDAVEQRLVDEARAGKRALLIVDEAQNLPVAALEELRMLSNFHAGGRALIQIVLLGQPEFRDRLASPRLEQLRQRVIAAHHLEAMDAGEVGAYVRHRLGLVGWAGRPDFEPEAFVALHAASGGIPRRVNQLAGRLLLHAAVEGLDRIDAAAVAAVAEDMGSDLGGAAETKERVLPLRSAAPAAAPPIRAANESRPEPRPAAPPPAAPRPFEEQPVERRIAALEARLAEQEAALRRAVAMMVDWVETPALEAAPRCHVA